MKNRLHCLFIVTLLQSPAFSQHKLTFHSINTLGISGGNSGLFAICQTVNGVEYKKWFGGIGISVDYYHYISYPVFLDMRYADKHHKAFAYLDMGYNFIGNDRPDNDLYYQSFSFSGGFYSDAGMGYRLRLPILICYANMIWLREFSFYRS